MTSWSQLDNRNLGPGGGQEVKPWQIGDVIMAYGVLATLLADRPGFVLMDGTVTLPGGVTPPSMVDNVPVGAGNLYAVGTTGGALSNSLTHNSLGSHQHDTIDLQHAHSLPNFAGLGFTAGASNPVIGSNTGITFLTHGLHVADGAHAHDAHSASTLQPYAALYFLIYTGTP